MRNDFQITGKNFQYLILLIVGNFGLIGASAQAHEPTFTSSSTNLSEMHFTLPAGHAVDRTTFTPVFPLTEAYGPPSPEPQQPAGRENTLTRLQDGDAEIARVKRRKIKTIHRLEVVYQLLGALDAAQTISCVHKVNCVEGNPILGKRPSDATIVAFKLAGGLLHYTAMTKMIKKEKYDTAMMFEVISISVQGVVCGLNFRYAF